MTSDPFNLPPLPPLPGSPNHNISNAIIVDIQDIFTSDIIVSAAPIFPSFGPSLLNNPFSPAGLSASSHRPIGYNKKCGYIPISIQFDRLNKTLRLSNIPKTAKDAIL